MVILENYALPARIPFFSLHNHLLCVYIEQICSWVYKTTKATVHYAMIRDITNLNKNSAALFAITERTIQKNL